MSPIVDWYINQLATHGLARRAQLRAERQQMAYHRDAINNAPQIPTQPGQDDDLLAACRDAWNAEPRKETP